MTIQNIALNKLALSDLNVRKVKPKEIEALAADIQARGVLQNLIGYDEDGKIKICAGGRRYRALKLLQKGKTIPGVDTFVAQGARLSRPDRGRLNRHSELAICTYAHNFRLRAMYICA